MNNQGPHAHLTSGRHLARNSIWNLVGQLLPMAVAVLAIPPIIRGLGVDRFGVLSLAWILLGYFSLFDLGLGRALTKLVADKLGAGQEQAIPALAWSSLVFLLLLGVAGGVVTLAAAPWLVHDVLKIPRELQPETLRTLYLLAVAIPTVTVTSGLRGILEALQRFRVLNLIRIPMSMFSFVGTLLVLPFSHSLVAVVAVLTIGRAVGVVVHLLVCFRALPALRRQFEINSSALVPALRFGGWMTVSNIVGPIMVYVDRFVIGVLLSVSVLAYYTVPFDMVTRLLFIPAAVAGVLFPAFAVSLLRDPDRVGVLLGRGVKYVVLIVFPIVLIVTALAPEGLRLWLGPAFAQEGSSVLRWLAAGIFVNCVAQVPFALIQGSGRPDITAKLHLAELPFYLAAVWLLTARLGLQGTAIAWTARATVDALLVCVFAGRVLPRKSRFLARAMTVISAGSLALYLVTLPWSLVVRTGLAALGLVGFALLGWFWFLSPDERAHVFQSPPDDAGRPTSLGDVPTHSS